MSNGVYTNIHESHYVQQRPLFEVPKIDNYKNPLLNWGPQKSAARYGQAYPNDKPRPQDPDQSLSKQGQFGNGNSGNIGIFGKGIMGGSVLGFE